MSFQVRDKIRASINLQRNKLLENCGSIKNGQNKKSPLWQPSTNFQSLESSFTRHGDQNGQTLQL